MSDIQYNYPVEKLDELISMIYEQGMTPLLPPDLRAEVDLRYQEMLHYGEDIDDDDDSAFANARRQHEEVMKNIEQQKRKSHSRNVLVLELTDEEKAELKDAMSSSYVRSDPNLPYYISDKDLDMNEERKRIYAQLNSLGKVYYHQEDFNNAIAIIVEAIEFSLKYDYPHIPHAEAVRRFNEGTIKFTYIQMPTLFVDYNTQIDDPKLLKGIFTGDINLTDKDAEPPKKKKRKSKPVEMPYSVITPAQHAEMVKIHQMGYNTDISTILKACSTVYNRYVIPTSFTYGSDTPKTIPEFDWMQPNAGAQYFDLIHGVKHNTTAEIVSLLNEQNDRKLNHVLGTSMKEFFQSWTPKEQSFKTISTSLEQTNEAVQIENKLLDLIRQTNAGTT